MHELALYIELSTDINRDFNLDELIKIIFYNVFLVFFLSQLRYFVSKYVLYDVQISIHVFILLVFNYCNSLSFIGRTFKIYYYYVLIVSKNYIVHK